MSAQVYISGGRLITAGGAVFGIPAAGPPPPPSGEENVVKFRSGMYMQSGNPNDQASMNAFSTSWAGNGGACQGYSAWYKWNLVETALGVYSFTSVFNDYAYLQSVAPGASFVPAVQLVFESDSRELQSPFVQSAKRRSAELHHQ